MLYFFSSEHIFASVVVQQPQQICFTNNTCLVKQCNEPTRCYAGGGCSWGSGAAGRSPNPALNGPGFPQPWPGAALPILLGGSCRSHVLPTAAVLGHRA